MTQNTLQLTVQAARPNLSSTVQVEVARVFNFGYAGRSREEVEKHIEELREYGFAAPTRIPSIYCLPVKGVVTSDQLSTATDQTYGEVEFALVLTEDGWCVSIASDHTDLTVEGISTPLGKSIYPDVISGEVWLLDDVVGHWDSLELICERQDTAAGWETIQQGSVSELMDPKSIIAELETRSGEAASLGTVILSGTIGGEIRPGAQAWRVTLRDSATGRELSHTYQADIKAIEI